MNLPGLIDARKLLRDLSSQEEDCAVRQVNKPLILYGAGDLGKMAKEYFKRLRIPFLYVVDANAKQYSGSTAWSGISVLRPEDIPQKDRERCVLVICIATVSYTQVMGSLIKQGWKDIVPFYDITEAYVQQDPLSNGWFSGPFDDDDREGTKYALDHWADDISRAHYLQFIAWHKLRREIVFDGAPVTIKDRFFIPEIISLLDEKEFFLDGGAHHGEVSLRFMDTVHQRFSSICAVEPDKYNVKVLRAKFADMSALVSQDISIVECALGAQTGSARFFHGLNYASQLSPMTEEVALVRSLDDMDIPATFIKLHLEGWEYEALQGGMRMLKEYRPILAVTTYHKRNGLWPLPVLLMKALENYIFLFRLHSWMGTGSVLYAIPRERYSGR